VTNEKLKEILDSLRVSDSPSLLAFLPDEENQNTLLRNLPAAVLIRDCVDSIILEANDYALRLFGTERQLLIGSSLSDLGLSIHFFDAPSSSSASGNPRKARITDSQGVEIASFVFSRKIEISGRQADLFIILDRTMLGSGEDNSQASRYSIMKRCLSVLSQGYIMAEIAGSSLEQDLVVIEVSDKLPAKLKAPIRVGESITSLFSPFEAARIIETAVSASDSGELRTCEVETVGSIEIFPGSSSLVLLSFAVEHVLADTDQVVITESQPGSEVVKSVLLLSPDGQDLDSGSEMLKMLGFAVTAHSSPGQALKDYSKSPDRFLFLMADIETMQPELKELIKELHSGGKHMILACNTEIHGPKDIPPDFKLVYVRKPYGINDIASAVSEVF